MVVHVLEVRVDGPRTPSSTAASAKGEAQDKNGGGCTSFGQAPALGASRWRPKDGGGSLYVCGSPFENDPRISHNNQCDRIMHINYIYIPLALVDIC